MAPSTFPTSCARLATGGTDGLAAGGTPGVRKAMTILRSELERAMGLAGVGSIEEVCMLHPTAERGSNPRALETPVLGSVASRRQRARALRCGAARFYALKLAERRVPFDSCDGAAEAAGW